MLSVPDPGASVRDLVTTKTQAFSVRSSSPDNCLFLTLMLQQGYALFSSLRHPLQIPQSVPIFQLCLDCKLQVTVSDFTHQLFVM